MMRRSAGTFGIISLDGTFLSSLTHHDGRVKVKRIIIKNQLREKPLEQLTEYALIDCLGKLVEITLICTMVSTTFPAKKLTKRCIITYHIKMTKAVGTTPYTGKQTKGNLYGLIATV